MRTRWVWFIAVLSWCGCSVPDDPNWDTLNRGIEALPPPVKIDAKRWAANRNAIDAIEKLDPDEEIFTVLCEETPGTQLPDPNGDYAKRYKFTVADMLRCLLAGSGADQGNKTYRDCFNQLSQNASRSYADETGFEPDCFPWFVDKKWGEYAEPKVPSDWDAKLVVTEEIAGELVKSPTAPAWFFAAVTLAGGVLVVVGSGGTLTGFLPALCTLQAGDGWGCPTHPAYPPGQTPQPDRAP